MHHLVEIQAVQNMLIIRGYVIWSAANSNKEIGVRRMESQIMEKDKRGNNGVLPKEVLAENEISAVCGGGGGIVCDRNARGRVVVGLGVEKVLEARNGGRSASCCCCFWLEREKRDLAELKLQLSGVTDT